MHDSTYDEIVAEIAGDLGLNEDALRLAFRHWINVRTSMESYMDVACYAVYRLTKARSAFYTTSRSRERWRDRAMELGSPGHLV